ncbi:hypothetical protein RO3G_07718 [Rhizopus delemar RA 99-880]|uniref:Uncharacterized protein n=1 Tax=Rhizopus delemar (strain RA 99-880 / ATCC MYA-4621 / FGSC 9543 / NRRL 43880) TaxID=246409 RepID=I1C3I3_RHIO9|nr:hypothetical protein RO3G_07718 [Rhizopus delemar RA 99-880]|eukprot:EIE83013.1 hypothetical protein RO3G_07718 [Rhizopus delemar RA 99-880]
MTLYQEKIKNNCSKNNNIIEYNIDGNESEIDELETSSDETGCEDISDKKHLLVYVKLVEKLKNSPEELEKINDDVIALTNQL